MLRAAAWLSGAEPEARVFSLHLDSDFQRRKTERVEYRPCRLTQEGTVKPIEYHGSAHLIALTQADGFFTIPVGIGTIAAGEEGVVVREVCSWGVVATWESHNRWHVALIPWSSVRSMRVWVRHWLW